MTGDETPNVRGPYWIAEARNGDLNICGRHGKIMFRYKADQDAMAKKHLRRLQSGHKAAVMRLHNAADEMLDALMEARNELEALLAGSAPSDPLYGVWMKVNRGIRAATNEDRAAPHK